MCPYCHSDRRNVKKKGFFSRKSDGGLRRVRRFFCKRCNKSFSCRTQSTFRGERKSRVNDKLFRLLCAGVSQRECARVLHINKTTVARKIVRLGKWAKAIHEKDLERMHGYSEVVFDEMETFEHSKCKPLSIAVAVDHKTRRIYAARVAKMPAKGKLAAIALKRYGYRPDHRARGLREMFTALQSSNIKVTALRSDECPRYPPAARRYFPQLKHERYKGRRGCVVGQGELKRGGFDPLFSLNHTCAMFRDHVKRLSRRTWCTTKNSDRLQDLLYMYIIVHNQRLKARDKPSSKTISRRR